VVIRDVLQPIIPGTLNEEQFIIRPGDIETDGLALLTSGADTQSDQIRWEFDFQYFDPTA